MSCISDAVLGIAFQETRHSYVIELVNRVTFDRVVPSASEFLLQPAGTAGSVGIRDVTPYVPSL